MAVVDGTERRNVVVERGRRDAAKLADLHRLELVLGDERVDRRSPDVQALGGKRWDTSSLIARLEKPKR